MSRLFALSLLVLIASPLPSHAVTIRIKATSVEERSVSGACTTYDHDNNSATPARRRCTVERTE